MLRFGLSAFAAATLAASVLPALAHHSDAMFDNGKEVTLNGTVKEFQYTNPHSWIQLRVAANEGATPVEWSIETAAPIVLVSGDSGLVICSAESISSSGFTARITSDVMSELRQLDLPAPVAPEIRTWGISARFTTTVRPEMSRPIGTSSG